MNLLTYLTISGLLNGVSCLALGIFVFFKNKKRLINRTFFFFAISVAVWSFGYFFWPLARTKVEALNAFRLLHFGATYIVVCYYHFISTLIGKTKENAKAVIAGYCIATFFVISIPTKLFIQDIEPKFIFEFWAVPGILYHFYLLFFFCYAFLATYSLLKEFRKSRGERQKQYLYVLIATIIGYLGGSTNYPLWYNIPIYPVANILVTLYVATIAYTIIRHRLMDIEVVIKKTFVFASLFAAVFGLFVGITLLSQELIIGGKLLGLAISSVVIIFAVRPFEDFLVKITDTFLFQKKYDYKQLLKTFSDEVLTVLELDKLVNLTVNKLVDIVKLDNASIMLYNEEREEFRMAASMGLKMSPEYILKNSERLIAYIRRMGRYVLHEDAGHGRGALAAGMERKISELHAALVIPLTYRENMVGILFLGKKKSDEEFTQDDIDVLLPLARTLSIAIINAQLFEKLSAAQAQAAQREKMAVIGTLSAGINHEICNPLGIARGQCEMFLLNLAEGFYRDKSPEKLLEKAREIMQKVINETDRATLITKKLASFAKPAKDKTEDNVQVEKELDEVISLVEHDLKLDNIIIIKDIEDGLPCISVDRKQIQEVLFNIIWNAAQSIRENGEIVIRASSASGKVHIDIEDSGPGISKRYLSRIFDPFFTTKEPGKGTGLGLFIVKQIVERNNGRITVQSEPGKGTVFSLVFNAAGTFSHKVEVSQGGT